MLKGRVTQAGHFRRPGTASKLTSAGWQSPASSREKRAAGQRAHLMQPAPPYSGSYSLHELRRAGVYSVVRTRPHHLAATRNAARGAAPRRGQRLVHWTAVRPQRGGSRRGMPGRQYPRQRCARRRGMRAAAALRARPLHHDACTVPTPGLWYRRHRGGRVALSAGSDGWHAECTAAQTSAPCRQWEPGFQAPAVFWVQGRESAWHGDSHPGRG